MIRGDERGARRPGTGVVGPLLETKLHMPGRRPGAVSRPRLGDRLLPAARSRLTLVSAPAGFGKTTMLVHWLAETTEAAPAGGPAVAWVSLDERDNEPATFWTYVITALQAATDSIEGADGGVGAAALGLLGSPHPPTATALATLLNDLQALPGEVLLVLDDYHVIDARDIHDGMGYLLDHLPPSVHVVLATRADPPLPLARLRARGDLVDVRSADLRFTRAEAAEYLAGPMGLALAPADVTTLAERTEGWAAALQLAGLSLQDRADASAAVARFAGDDRYIVDYLAEEVLARLPDDVRDFLLTTSVLDRLTGPLCDAVTGHVRRRSAAGGARARQPLPRPARRPPAVVPVPPPVRRRAPRAPARATAGPGRRAAPPGQLLAPRQRRTDRGHPARAGRRRRRRAPQT